MTSLRVGKINLKVEKGHEAGLSFQRTDIQVGDSNYPIVE